ncbi:MAG: hypothetical protein Tsb0020_47440 [Haliangiales bacterium]
MSQLVKIGMFVALTLALNACAVADHGDEVVFSADEFAQIETELVANESLAAEDDISLEATKDCYVRITCSNGTNRACNGTNGQCAASSAGAGSVTCNGSSNVCPSSPPPPPQCGSFCFSNADCGAGAACDTFSNRCVCF